MHDVVEWIIMVMQCVLLLYVTNVANLLEDSLESSDTHKCRVQSKHWVVHVVRDTDDACTPCVVVMRSGHLVEMDTDAHAALLAASRSHDSDALLAGDTLHDVEDANGPVRQMVFTRTVHHGTRREVMQQALEEHKCDLVPVHDDAPPPFLVLNNAHAVLGVLLARQQPITESSTTCASTRPKSQATSPRRTPSRRCGAASACVTTPTTSSTSTA